MSLESIVFDCTCARVTTTHGEPIPLVDLTWDSGFLVLRGIHGEGLIENFANGTKRPESGNQAGGMFLVSLSYPSLGSKKYLVHYEEAIVCPCELPGGDKVVLEVVALRGAIWTRKE